MDLLAGLPACWGECCLGEFISGGSSLKDTDFSNDTDLSEIDFSFYEFYTLSLPQIINFDNENHNIQVLLAQCVINPKSHFKFFSPLIRVKLNFDVQIK